MNERYTKYTERPVSYCIFEIGNGRKPEQADIEAANEQLTRFINDTINHREPTEGDKQAAADALIYAMSGNDLQAMLGLQRKRGQRKKTIDPDHVYINDPLFGIVCQLVSEKITNAEAIQRFYDECKERTGKGLDERTIQRYIKAIRPRAERFEATFETLSQYARKKPTE